MFEQHKDAHLAISRLAPEFLLYAKVELAFSPETILKYRDCLRQVEKICGDLQVTGFFKSDLLVLKADLISRNLGVSRQVGIVLALKRVLSSDAPGGSVQPPSLTKLGGMTLWASS